MITRTDITLVSVERDFTHSGAPGLGGSIVEDRAKLRYADESGFFQIELPREHLELLGELVAAMASDVEPLPDAGAVAPEPGTPPILDEEEGVS